MIAALAVLLLGGCGSGTSIPEGLSESDIMQGNADGQVDAAGAGDAAGQGEAASEGQSIFAGTEPADIADALIGAEQMSGHIRELKTAIESDDVTRSRELAGMMASIWLAMETEVRDSQPELHKSLHGDLTALLTGLQEEKWDKAGLVELDYVLYQSFRDLRGKLEL